MNAPTRKPVSEERKAALIDLHRDINVDYDWWGDTYWGFVEILNAYGWRVTTRDIEFSGFWSQVDGACFAVSATPLADVVLATPFATEAPIAVACAALQDELVRAITPILVYSDTVRQALSETLIRVSNRGRHSHSGTMLVEIEEPCVEGLPQHVIDFICPDDWRTSSPLEDVLTEGLRGLADILYRELERKYEYLTSDEAVWDTIEDNGLDTPDEDDEEEEEEDDDAQP